MQQRGSATAVTASVVTGQLPLLSTGQLETLHARIDAPIDRAWAYGSKRAMDIVVSALLLVMLSPLLIMVALGVRLTSGGPAIFVQTRCGLRGRTFRFYKFRSMVADADARKAELIHLNEVQGPAFKIARDPRITRFGQFLRKYSLDELPQLWNVLIGNMSLVGPRPPTPCEVARYTRRQAQRLSAMPGITGLWQVSGRNNITSFDQWVELDLAYIERWSLGLDLRILARTVLVVLRAEGSC
jgi:exopolysaccharide biosynthesis polyprenyl glycosylphosphotransferase